jgi:uncharacterized protein YaeQ
MALSATIYNFDVNLADVDRGVYEQLVFKVAMHPSEAMEYMLLRVLAYCLEYTEGIQFGKGIGQDDEPPVFAKDLTGQLTVWVEIGLPDAERMHRAAKAAPRAALYTHRDAPILWRNFEGATIHRADEVPLYVVDVRFLRRLGEKIDRRNSFDLSITERQVFLSLGGETFETSIPALPLQRTA